MPGITGIYLKNGTDLNIKDLSLRMVKSITHENWYKVDSVMDKKIAFNRVNLGILNPESQPFFNKDKTIWIMMEGEIHNHGDLKKELTEKGHIFKWNNDPQLILHLYEEYRLDFGKKLKDLNGIFLAVIYDSELHQLIICNDRYGFRPLYWCDRSDYLLFSSELKAILQDRNFKRLINLEAMVDFFCFGYVLGDKTLVEGVKLLPPASLLTCSEKGAKINKYWDWNQIRRVKITNEEEIIEELGRLWLQAVNRRMQGKARIGLSLSGGLDSRAIASAISPKYYPIHAVTFGKSGCHDYKIAKRIADILRIEHHYVEITAEKWLANIEKTVYITEGFLNVIHQHSWDAIDVMKKYSDINLNAFAGDLVVGGSYLTEEFLKIEDTNEYFGKVFWKMNVGHILVKNEKKFYNSQILNIVHGLSQRSLKKEVEREVRTPISSDYFFLNNRVGRFTLMGTVCNQTKLENRKPFFDNDFIEFVYSLPNELRFNHFIYNRMLLKFFPKTYESVPWQKTGLPIGTNKNIQIIHHYYHSGQLKLNRLLQMIGSPPLFKDDRSYVDYNNWMRSNIELRHYIYNMVLDRRALSRGYFKPDYIRKLIDDHMFGKKNNAQIIGLLLTFELFNRMFMDGDRL